MRTFIALGLAAVVAVLGGAVSAGSADSATATKVVYHSKVKRNNEIFVISSRGGAPTRLTRHRGSDSNPTWSADGRFIAFESNRHGRHRYHQDSDVFVMKADGSGIRELTFANNFDGDPAWSWLNRIAFESERTGQSDIWTIDAQGKDEQQLTTSRGYDADPAWSPDASKIVFTSDRDNGDREIYVMNADGTGQTRLTSSPGFDQNPSWSPNGKLIAFDSMRDGNLEIYVMRADGSGQTRLTNHPALDALPSWSQDSQRIVFVTERIRKGQRRVYVMNRNGTAVRGLTRGATDMSPDWARG
jgi:Tol biopolymer transport system component